MPRSSIVRAMLAASALAGPLSAQEFTGSITVTMSNPQMGEAMDATFYIAGEKQAMVMKMPASAGPMAGMEVRMVVNKAARQLTTLIPMPPGSPMPGKGMKQVTKFGDAVDNAADADVKITPLGTKQTVAGMSCDDYEVVTKDQTVKMCVTDKLGRYAFPELSGRSPRSPSWTRAFGDKPAFPLKLWQDDGKMSMTVTSVKRGDVPAPMFDENPEGYTSMPGMGG